MDQPSNQVPVPVSSRFKSFIQLYGTPLAIVVAGACIALALYAKPPLTTVDKVVAPNVQNKEVVAEDSTEKLKNIAPITEEDHIRGNPDAPVKIVEYSDTECPFCKRFHITMKQVMEAYGDSGEVAWVYRHFPLDQLHPEARKQAEASECAAELGGEDAFWKYIDRVYEVTPSNNGLKSSELPKIAAYVGLDVEAFNTCLASGRHAEKVERYVQNAIATGGSGTPWSIVVTKSGKTYPLSGAQPLPAIKQLIDTALQE